MRGSPRPGRGAIRAAKRPDGRMLAPAMPVASFKHLSEVDALAIAHDLKIPPPVRNKMPGPFGEAERPTSFVMKVVPPQEASARH
jgi:hypothetical protein